MSAQKPWEKMIPDGEHGRTLAKILADLIENDGLSLTDIVRPNDPHAATKLHKIYEVFRFYGFDMAAKAAEDAAADVTG